MTPDPIRRKTNLLSADGGDARRAGLSERALEEDTSAARLAQDGSGHLFFAVCSEQ